MTTKADFTDEEWARFERAPFVAGMAISMADPGGPIEALKETMATVKTVTEVAQSGGRGEQTGNGVRPTVHTDLAIESVNVVMLRTLYAATIPAPGRHDWQLPQRRGYTRIVAHVRRAHWHYWKVTFVPVRPSGRRAVARGAPRRDPSRRPPPRSLVDEVLENGASGVGQVGPDADHGGSDIDGDFDDVEDGDSDSHADSTFRDNVACPPGDVAGRALGGYPNRSDGRNRWALGPAMVPRRRANAQVRRVSGFPDRKTARATLTCAAAAR